MCDSLRGGPDADGFFLGWGKCEFLTCCSAENVECSTTLFLCGLGARSIEGGDRSLGNYIGWVEPLGMEAMKRRIEPG